jgi:hypothetical protein
MIKSNPEDTLWCSVEMAETERSACKSLLLGKIDVKRPDIFPE